MLAARRGKGRSNWEDLERSKESLVRVAVEEVQPSRLQAGKSRKFVLIKDVMESSGIRRGSSKDLRHYNRSRAGRSRPMKSFSSLCCVPA